MSTHAVVTIWQTEGALEQERTVDTLEALFDACRVAPPSRLVRITLKGTDGEVALSFSSFIQPT